MVLVEGIRAASVVPTFFSRAVAASMLGVAASGFLPSGERRARAMRRGCQAGTRAARCPVAVDGVGVDACTRAHSDGARRTSSGGVEDFADVRLLVAEYGLGVPPSSSMPLLSRSVLGCRCSPCRGRGALAR